jgi:hypothetical protein
MTIIFVFDPLAVLLLIAGQMSLIQASDARRSKKEKQDEPPVIPVIEPVPIPNPVVEVIVPEPVVIVEPVVPQPEPIKEDVPVLINSQPLINDYVKAHIEEQLKEKLVSKPKRKITKKNIVITDGNDNSIFEPLDLVIKEKPVEYVQNSEQGETTLWQRVQRSRHIFKPMDVLYSEYIDHVFRDSDLSNQDQTDPEIQLLTKYVNDIKNNNIKFDDIPETHREKLADLITSEQSNTRNIP